MISSLDLHKELRAAVRDAAAAWRFIGRFAGTSATALGAGNGYDNDELEAAQARLGFSLPASLREVYALIGKRHDLTRSQDRLLTPDQVRVDDTGQVLVFRVENQHVAEWGIPLSAVAEPDPPVMLRLDRERVWHPFLDRVTLACVEMVLSGWMFSGHLFAADRELDDDAVGLLQARFRRLPMPDYPLWSWPGGRPIRWFEGLGAILREDAGTWLWVRAASADGIDAVRRALPGGWLVSEASRPAAGELCPPVR